MTLFGEKFYPTLNKLSPWRQSLFALVLAHRQFPNFELWVDTVKHKGKAEYNFALKKLWEYHLEKFNHIDLEKVLDVFDPFVPDPDKDGDSLGTLFALDAAASLTAAFDAIILHQGDEAEIASRSSLAAVVRMVENNIDEDLDEEAMREQELVDNEINFQIDLMEMLRGAKRDPDLAKMLIKIAIKDHISNIGIEQNDLHGCRYEDYAAHNSHAGKN